MTILLGWWKMMNWNRILAMMRRDYYQVKNSTWRKVEMFFHPITTILIWGYFSLFIADVSPEAGVGILLIQIFWSFAFQSQSTINFNMMEDVWSREFPTILKTPITTNEYIVSRILFSAIKSAVTFVTLVGISLLLFQADIITQNLGLIFILGALVFLASVSIAIITGGAIITLGQEYSFLTWTVMQIFIVLAAPFFPIEIYPGFLHPIVKLIPLTWVFDTAKTLVATNTYDIAIVLRSFYLGLAYLAASVPIFYYLFARAKNNGRLARLA